MTDTCRWLSNLITCPFGGSANCLEKEEVGRVMMVVGQYTDLQYVYLELQQLAGVYI